VHKKWGKKKLSNDGLCAGKKKIVFGKTTFQDDLTEREGLFF